MLQEYVRKAKVQEGEQGWYRVTTKGEGDKAVQLLLHINNVLIQSQYHVGHVPP